MSPQDVEYFLECNGLSVEEFWEKYDSLHS